MFYSPETEKRRAPGASFGRTGGGILATVLALFCFLLSAVPSGARVLSTDLVRESRSLLPYFSWSIDAEGLQGIEEISSGKQQKQFVPMSWGMPLRGGGPVWLRLVLVRKAPGPGAVSLPGDRDRLVMNLGQLPPGENSIFFSEYPGPVSVQGIWHSEAISSYEDVLLPNPGQLPVSVYVRMDEMPGLWFSPTVSAQGAAQADMRPSALLLPGLLIATGLVCLLRLMAERSVWAFWAMAFFGCALIQVLIPLPGVRQPFILRHLPALLAPGLCLMILPHIGRCLFQRPELSGLEKAVLFLCTLAGAAAALLPLLPGLGWLIRLFPLWPLLLAMVFPPCMGFLAAKRPGAFGFSAVCILGILGAALALYGLRDPDLHPLISQAALWGIAVGGLFLSLVRVPKESEDDGNGTSVTNAELLLPESVPSGAAKPESPGPYPGPLDPSSPALSSGLPPDGAPLYPEETSTQDETHRLRTPGVSPGMPAGFAPENAEASPVPAEQGQRLAMPAPDGSSPHTVEDEALEAVLDLGTPYGACGKPEHSLREACPPDPADAARVEAQRPVSFKDETQEAKRKDGGQSTTAAEAVERREASGPLQHHEAPGDGKWLSMMLPSFAGQIDGGQSPVAEGAKVISLLDEAALHQPSPPPGYAEDHTGSLSRGNAVPSGESYVFNLHALVRDVHDIVSPLARSRGLMFSWFIAPSLPALLEGDAPRLRGALSLLLQNAVHATNEGGVQLSVRKTPGSPFPADLLFSITDSGSAQRTDAGFFHAWELAARSGGVFTVEYSPGSGTQVSFTARFALPSEEVAEAHQVHFSREEYLEKAYSYAEDDEDALIPVLQTVAEKQPGPESLHQNAYGPEEPRLAAMTQEEVLADQGFLEPLGQAPPVENPVPEAGGASFPAVDEGPPEAVDANPETTPFSPGPDGQPGLAREIRICQSAEFASLAWMLPGPGASVYDSPVYHRAGGAEEYGITPYRDDAWTAFAEPAPFAASPAAIVWESDGLESKTDRPRHFASGLIEVPPVPAEDLTTYAVYSPQPKKERPQQENPPTTERNNAAAGNGDKAKPLRIRGKLDIFSSFRKKAVPAMHAPVPLSSDNEKAPQGTVENPSSHEQAASFKEARSEPGPVVSARGGDAAPHAPEPASMPELSLEEERKEKAHAEAGTGPGNADPTGEATALPGIAEGGGMQNNAGERHDEEVLHEPAEGKEHEKSLSPASAVIAGPDSPPFPGPDGGAPAAGREEAEQPVPRKPLDEALPIEVKAPAANPEAAHAKKELPIPADKNESLSALPVGAAALSAQDAPRIAKDALPPIVIAETTTSNRRLMAHYLADLPYRHLYAPGNAKVRELFDGMPLSLVIFDGDMPEQDSIATIKALRQKEREHGLAHTFILCLSGQQAQSARLLEAGSDHVLMKPFSREEFLERVALATPATAGFNKAEPAESAAAGELFSASLVEAAPAHAEAVSGPPRRSPLAEGLLGVGVAPAREPGMAASFPSSSRKRVGNSPPSPLAADAGQRATGTDAKTQEKGKPRVRITASVVSLPDAANPEKSPSPSRRSLPEGIAQVTRNVSLPGLDGESLDVSVMPLVPGLLHFLEHAFKDAVRGKKEKKSILVQEASGRLASRAEAFGLQRLAKVARCVERAAEADDTEAIKALLEDLRPVIDRYMDSLNRAYDSFSLLKR